MDAAAVTLCFSIVVSCGAPTSAVVSPSSPPPSFADADLPSLDEGLFGGFGSGIIAAMERCGDVDLGPFEGVYLAGDQNPDLVAFQVEDGRVRFGVGVDVTGYGVYGREEICPADVLGRDDDELLARGLGTTVGDDEAHLTYLYLRREGEDLVVAHGSERRDMNRPARLRRADVPLPGLSFQPGALPELASLVPARPSGAPLDRCASAPSALEGELALDLRAVELPPASSPILREVQRALVQRLFGRLALSAHRLEAGPGSFGLCLTSHEVDGGVHRLHGVVDDESWVVEVVLRDDRATVRFARDVAGFVSAPALPYTRVADRAEWLAEEDQVWFPLEILGLGADTAVAHRLNASPLWTRDGGASWAPFDVGVEGDLGDVLALEGAWYVTIGDVVLRSRDQGRSYERIATLDPAVGVFDSGWQDGGRYRTSGLREARLVPAGPETIWIVRSASVLELSPARMRTLWQLETTFPLFSHAAAPPYGDVPQPARDGARLLRPAGESLGLFRMPFGSDRLEPVVDVPLGLAAYVRLGEDEVVVLEAGCEARIRRRGASSWSPFADAIRGHDATSVAVAPMTSRALLVACEPALAANHPGASAKILRVTEGRADVVFDAAVLGERSDVRPPFGPAEVVGREVWFPQAYASPGFGGVVVQEDGSTRVFTVPAP